MSAAGFLLWAVAGLAVLLGVFWLGVWVGLGMAEDRRQRAECEALWEHARDRHQAPRPTLLLQAAPAHPADNLPPWRTPGYADVFPRPGRLLLEQVPAAVAAASWPTPTAPYLEPARPITSPVDLEAEVRRMCLDSELYVAALIARARHTEGDNPR